MYIVRSLEYVRKVFNIRYEMDNNDDKTKWKTKNKSGRRLR